MKKFEKPEINSCCEAMKFEPFITAESGCTTCCCPFEKTKFDRVNCPTSGCGRKFIFDQNNNLISSDCPKFNG